MEETLAERESSLISVVYAQLHQTLWDPMKYSLPDSSDHWILLARIVEWVAIFSSRRSSWPRDQTHISDVSCTGWQILYHWTTWEAPTSLEPWVNQLVIICCAKPLTQGVEFTQKGWWKVKKSHLQGSKIESLRMDRAVKYRKEQVTSRSYDGNTNAWKPGWDAPWR